MDAIRWNDDHTLSLLDQTKLPLSEQWVTYTQSSPVAEAIRTMVVRGAPAIGITAAYAMVLAARQHHGSAGFLTQMKLAKDELAASRPTAVNLFWALDRMWALICRAGDDPDALEREAAAIHRG